MWNNYLNHWALPLSIFGIAVGGIVLVALIIWSVYWKGRALWQAARRNSKPWFAALLVINTLGILEILYIYVFSKKKER